MTAETFADVMDCAQRASRIAGGLAGDSREFQSYTYIMSSRLLPRPAASPSHFHYVHSPSSVLDNGVYLFFPRIVLKKHSYN